MGELQLKGKKMFALSPTYQITGGADGASSFCGGILYLLQRPSAVYVAPPLLDSALHSFPPSLLLLPVSTATVLMSKCQKQLNAFLL